MGQYKKTITQPQDFQTTRSTTITVGDGKSQSALYESIGKDVYFYVSGSHDVNAIEDRRVAVFGGDVVISGSLTVEGGDLAGSFNFDCDVLELTGSIHVNGAGYFTGGISGSITRLTDGSPYMIGSHGINITTGSKGEITISTSVIEWNERVGYGDGINSVFTLAYVPSNPLSVMLFVNGILQERDEGTADFHIDGSTIIFNYVPAEGSKITATYSRY